MRSYPIYNQVTSCIYNSNKSYGVKEVGEVTVKVGTSKRNSYNFLNHRTTHKLHDNGDREYRFYLDDVLIKRAILKKNSNSLKYIDTNETEEA